MHILAATTAVVAGLSAARTAWRAHRVAAETRAAAHADLRTLLRVNGWDTR